MRTRAIGIGTVLALLAALAAGCGESSAGAAAPSAGPSTSVDPPGGGYAPGDPRALDKRHFTSRAVIGDGTAPATAGGLSLIIDGSKITVRACNTMTGRVTLADGRLAVAWGQTTMKACETSLMELDAWVRPFLSAGPRWTYHQGTLTLSGADGELRLTSAAIDPIGGKARPLQGTTWRVVWLNGRGVAGTFDSAVRATLLFERGRVTGTTGCNTFSGDAAVAGTAVTIGTLVMTKRACEGEADRVERAVLATLAGRVTARTGNVLMLEHPSGAGLTLHPDR